MSVGGVMRVILGCVMMLTLVACGGDTSTTVTTSPTTTTSAPSVLVVFAAVGGTFTAQLNNQTYAASGGFTVSLPVGTYQITGSFRGSGFGVNFSNATLGGGGVTSGSILSLSGPSPTVTACQIVYTNLSQSTAQINFSLQFQVTSSGNSACQGF